MNDLTILYYTANTIPDITGKKIRDNLLKVTKGNYPIISVSQKPIKFGRNICVGQIGRSKYNCYKQILIGVREVKTKYVACAEDDVLYSEDHFKYRPKNGRFSYETNMWFATPNRYWRREIIKSRAGMWGCISSRNLLLKNLTKRYSLYPIDPLPKGNKSTAKNRSLAWGEPGYRDEQFGLKNKISFFESGETSLVFLYKESMGGRHAILKNKIHSPENVSYNLKSFGGAVHLWNYYWS